MTKRALLAAAVRPFGPGGKLLDQHMPAFNAFADAELAASPMVRRYETSFVKKEIKNRPMIRLDERDAQV